MSDRTSLENYETYRNLPPLAGIATMAEAARPGLSVEQVVARLKRYHYSFKRLHEILTARITAEPVYELKTAFSLHSYLCSEHVAGMRDRVAEMREPPLGLDVVPDTSLEIFYDEILASPTTAELIVGVYDVALPALHAAMKKHIAETNPLADAPSVRICRFALMEVDDMIAFGKQAVASLVDAAARQRMSGWVKLLNDCLGAAGSLDGSAERTKVHVIREHSATPYVYDKVPKRDERFIDPFNRGVNCESFLYNPSFDNRAKTLMMYYKRIREIDVPEMMASIIAETKGKPWGYYRDMSRQLWDEARHAMMGEVGFASLGIDWRKLPITITWAHNLNTQLKAMERHGVLFFIEQGLMPKTGKRYEWEVGVASGDALSGLFQDYDWADEVLHAAIGRQWYVKDFGNPKDAIKYGDECWSKVVSDFRELIDKGLTQHRNWWPGLYAEACKKWGIQPDPAALAFDETYETSRADLKEISASG